MLWYAATLIRLPITLLAAAVVLVGGSIYAYVNKLVIPVDLMNYFGEFFRWLTQYVIGYEAFKPGVFFGFRNSVYCSRYPYYYIIGF